MGKIVFASVLLVIALGLMMFNLRSDGPNAKKVTPKTTTFECISKKCGYRVDLLPEESTPITNEKPYFHKGDAYWKCPECDRQSFHTYYENSTPASTSSSP